MGKLSGIEIFVQVAETRSFSETAKQRGVSSSAVGKSIARLESRLSAQLFYRSTRSITLTTEGAHYLERCRRILAEVESAERELLESHRAPQGQLKISLPLVDVIVLPLVSGFMRRYPDIMLDIDMTDRMVDIIEEGFDAVIRTGTPLDSRLKSRFLGGYQRVVVAAPSYLSQRTVPQQPADLAQHACLLHKYPGTGRIEAWTGVNDAAELPAAMVCNTNRVIIDAALNGLGIACLPEYQVRQALLEGTLTQVLAHQPAAGNGYWALWPASKHVTPKLRAFIDYLAEYFAENPLNGQ
ncbi:LysR substrate-binding domain-containing protein [Rouxiella chamberiensis]|uniref:LysR substrate-binding domain-containing protein n=1 Tax=Rouxiella chamberiensis TaxID=1513468 RepID=A0ABY7HMF9_9GAMM|nr:LysR substrate-binding domain-containing protein [Rouxiella chamberiensis]WAT00428.1 LysR substrate-binding domain-containing protein [Rouxiella chamberiensis]